MGFRSNVPPFAMLRAFDACGRTGRIRRAAAELGVSHAIVSRHMRALEDWLGVILIDRQNGGLTAIGQDYYARIAMAFDQIGAVTELVSGRSATRLNIWSTPGFAYHWLTAQLPEFSGLYPSAALDLRPTDAPPDLLRRQADADIRWVVDSDIHPTPKGIRAIELIRPRVFPVARSDAAWLKDVRINHPADVLQLPLLEDESDEDWRAWLAANDISGASPKICARLWQAHMTLAAAADGQGVALTNYFLAAQLLESGQLIEVTANVPNMPHVAIGAYRFVTRSENWEAGIYARFRRWLMGAIEKSSSAWRLPIREI